MIARSTALALLVAAPADAQDELTIVLDWFVNPDHGPIVIAEEQGYFADAGLEVEMIAPADPADPPKMAAAGRADLAISYQPQLHLQVAEGMPLVRVGTLVATPLNCLLVLEDGPVEEIADLEGRKVGFSVAGVEEALLSAMLGRNGLTMDDIELVNVNWSLSPALMSGQVDAVIGAFRNFELNQMEIEGVPGRCFYPEEEGLPAYDELIYVANPETMDEGVILRFLAATEKATQFIVNHPQESWKIFAATSAELQDELNERAWADTIPRFALRPEALDQGRYARFEAFLEAAGLIEGTRPVSAPRRRSGRAMTYGTSFPLWRAAAGETWRDYTRHAFVEGMRDGTLRARGLPALSRSGLPVPRPFLPRLGAGRDQGRNAGGDADLRRHRPCAAGRGDAPACRDLRRRGHIGSEAVRGPRGTAEHRLYPLRPRRRPFGRLPRPDGRTCPLRAGLRRDRRAAGGGGRWDNLRRIGSRPIPARTTSAPAARSAQ